MSGRARRVTAVDRVRRLLTLVPWVVERGGASISEICDRFQVSRNELLQDLDVVFMVGVPPYTPDSLIDVVVEDDWVTVTMGDYFRRPLRFSADQALAVIGAGDALMAVPGADDGGALARALAKVRPLVGLPDSSRVEVSLGHADPEVLELLEGAISDGAQVGFDYYSFGRDEHAARVVDPWRLVAHRGNWYLIGHCHTAGAERFFRLDRISEPHLNGEPVSVVAAASDRVPGDVGASRSGVVTLEIPSGLGWIATHYAVTAVEPLGDGRLQVTLPVWGEAWLARLLLRLGPEAVVVESSGVDAEGVRRRAAESVLAKYRSSPVGPTPDAGAVPGGTARR